MGDESEADLANAMIRMYGRDAEAIAMGHAETHADTGDQTSSDKWQRIAVLVANLTRASQSADAQSK
ncbi:MAG TPA: hypothetical protein VGM68_06930 [Rhizomicrobium sp.]